MNLVRASKFLSLLLRHKPEAIGLSLDGEGWAVIDDIVRLTVSADVALTRELVLELVSTSDKQRFRLSDDGLRVRANQGHSLDVDLQLPPREPPAVLFHGTAEAALASIRVHGLQPQKRQFVHLSSDAATAHKVGARHGKPVVLRVHSRAMFEAGQAFFVADNGVWLTSSVAPAWIEFPPART